MPIVNGKIPRLTTRRRATRQLDRPGVEGVNILFSETRLDINEAKETLNLIPVEDGILGIRWGSEDYTDQSFTQIDGFSEYLKSDGTRELIVIDNGVAYRMTTSSKTSISGATFTAGNKCFFLQTGSELYIGNGVDALVRYNGSTLAQYTALDVPDWAATPLARGGGLSAGNYTYYYQVTAVNEVGETTPAAEEELTVNKDRDIWSGATEKITLDWDAVTGALKYIIYFADASGYEVKLAEVTGATTYDDDGSAVPNPYIEPPTGNSTGGPKLRSMAVSNNRIWGVDPNEKYKTYFSGTGVNRGNFSPAFGGGWIELEKGGRALVEAVTDFQGTAHALCSTPEGRGTVWQITLSTVTIDGSDFVVPIPTKIIASNGTNAAGSVVYMENDVAFVNKNGAQVLGNEPNILGVLRTNELSAKLRPYFTDTIWGDRFTQIAAYYYQKKLFISVPTEDGDNNRTIVFDRERSMWIKDWDIGVSQFGEYTDSDGITHFLGSTDTELFELSPNYKGDRGVAFTARFVSPTIPVTKDWTEWAQVMKAYTRLRDVVGNVNFTFSGTRIQDDLFTQLNTGEITGTVGASDTGIGWDPIGTVKIGWTEGEPTVFARESLIKYLVIDEILRDFRFTIETTGQLRDQFVLTGLIAEGYEKPIEDPLDWML